VASEVDNMDDGPGSYLRIGCGTPEPVEAKWAGRRKTARVVVEGNGGRFGRFQAGSTFQFF